MSSDVASDDDASDASRFVCVTLGCTGKVSKGQHSAIISEKDGSDTFLASSGELQGHDGILTGDSVTVLLIQTFASPTCPLYVINTQPSATDAFGSGVSDLQANGI